MSESQFSYFDSPDLGIGCSIVFPALLQSVSTEEILRETNMAITVGKFQALVEPSAEAGRYIVEITNNSVVVIDTLTKSQLYYSSRQDTVRLGFGPQKHIFVEAEVIERSTYGAPKYYSLVLYDLNQKKQLLLLNKLYANSSWGFSSQGDCFLVASINSDILGQDDYIGFNFVNVNNGATKYEQFLRSSCTYTFSPNGDVFALIFSKTVYEGYPHYRIMHDVFLYQVSNLNLVGKLLDFENYDHLETKNDGHYILKTNNTQTKISGIY